MRFSLFLIAWAFWGLLPSLLPAQIHHWETVVNYNDTWKYRSGTSEPDTNWAKLGFNDAAWSQGPGGVGFGDGDDNTVISLVPSVYIRRSFNIVDTAAILQALLSIDYDDGFIAYLNNVEIARGNLGNGGGDRPPYNQYANGQHEAMMYQNGMPESFIITKAKLRTCLQPGTNVLAVTVHNATVNSADLSSLTWLHVGLTSTNTVYGGNPTWFSPPITSSNLPLVVVDTDGKTLQDTVRIVGDMGIIYNGPGIRNYLSDAFNDYNGRISIEIRGSTSQQYPKKSYGVETQDALGNNNNVPILGMPAENDWVLYAPYPDKTLMRNTLAYDLFGKMVHYSPRTRFCELIVNGEYKGVYEIHERIKIDNDRLDLAKLDADDNAGDSLTGGYVIKVDKQTGTGGWNWTSPVNPNVYFQYHDPEETELTAQQKSYIQGFVNNFENALNGPNFADPANGYRKYIDVQSFMDFQIMQELGRTVDGYRSSSFLHKQVDSYGGRLSAGPMWDFNLSFGNADYCDAFAIQGWQYQFGQICQGYVPEVPFWWEKLVSDPRYQSELRCRWDDLRAGPLATQTVTAWIDSVATVLDESKTRNFQRWPILGQYVNWNYFVGNTYAEEITWLKDWISQRLSWLDANWPTGTPVCNSPGSESISISEINYNSAATADAGDWFELVNSGFSPVDIGEWRFKDENPDNYFAFPAGTVIGPGEYWVVARDTALFRSRFPQVTRVVGPFNFALDNSGDEIRLFDKGYQPVTSLRYDDVAPWPTLADGGGFTLESTAIGGNPSDPANWTTGCPEGSPGAPLVLPCPVAVDPALPDWQVRVFPNPMQHQAIFETGGNLPDGGIWVDWYDLKGQWLRRDQLTNMREVVSTAQLPGGVYLLHLGDALQRTLHLKVVKTP